MRDKEIPLYLEVPKIPNFMFDFVKVILHEDSIKKHGANNWLNANGHTCDVKNMYGSIFRHVAKAYARDKIDPQSGLDHRLHAAARLLMDYTRDQMQLKHDLDK